MRSSRQQPTDVPVRQLLIQPHAGSCARIRLPAVAMVNHNPGAVSTFKNLHAPHGATDAVHAAFRVVLGTLSFILSDNSCDNAICSCRHSYLHLCVASRKYRSSATLRQICHVDLVTPVIQIVCSGRARTPISGVLCSADPYALTRSCRSQPGLPCDAMPLSWSAVSFARA